MSPESFPDDIKVKHSALKQRKTMSKNYLMEEARKVAKDMLDTNAIVEPVKTWGDGNTLFVSIDENAIYFTQTFILEGKRFFIGARLQKET